MRDKDEDRPLLAPETVSHFDTILHDINNQLYNVSQILVDFQDSLVRHNKELAVQSNLLRDIITANVQTRDTVADLRHTLTPPPSTFTSKPSSDTTVPGLLRVLADLLERDSDAC